MCFSAPVSFTAAAALAAIGAGTLAKVRRPQQGPLAAFPLLFAAQQTIEGLLWLTVSSGRAASLPLATAFAAIALVIWPLLTPVAFALVEPRHGRRHLLYALLLAGVPFALYSIVALIQHPYRAWPVGLSLTYVNNVPIPFALVAAYCLATVGPPLLSSQHLLKTFGATIALGVAVAVFAFYEGTLSVWCFFAALASAMLYLFFRRANDGPIKANDGVQ
jgi:Family of unknown function (DUF6629)